MIEGSKYCSEVMEKPFNKELVMTKNNIEDFKISDAESVIIIMLMMMMLNKWSLSIIGKYSGSAHRGCNINVKSSHKVLIVFYNLKDYDSHLIAQELGKFNLKINVIPNGLRRYMSFNINNS